MFDLRPLFRRSTWVALVAVLSMALLPTLSRAMAVASGGDLTQICTPQGMKLVSAANLIAATDGGAPASGGSLLEHCPYCSPSGGAAPLPVSATPWSVPFGEAAEVPAAIHRAPCGLFAWTNAQPRAPPAQS